MILVEDHRTDAIRKWFDPATGELSPAPDAEHARVQGVFQDMGGRALVFYGDKGRLFLRAGDTTVDVTKGVTSDFARGEGMGSQHVLTIRNGSGQVLRFEYTDPCDLVDHARMMTVPEEYMNLGLHVAQQVNDAASREHWRKEWG